MANYWLENRESSEPNLDILIFQWVPKCSDCDHSLSTSPRTLFLPKNYWSIVKKMHSLWRPWSLWHPLFSQLHKLRLLTMRKKSPELGDYLTSFWPFNLYGSDTRCVQWAAQGMRSWNDFRFSFLLHYRASGLEVRPHPGLSPDYYLLYIYNLGSYFQQLLEAFIHS